MARESSRANALLVELLLVIFFFMISAAILVQLFANARHKSIEAKAATAAKVRVIIESTDGQISWTTVGVSEDIIEASWIALSDSFEYKLIRDIEKRYKKII